MARADTKIDTNLMSAFRLTVISSTKRAARLLSIEPGDGFQLAVVKIDSMEVHVSLEERTLQYVRRRSWHHWRCSERLSISITTRMCVCANRFILRIFNPYYIWKPHRQGEDAESCPNTSASNPHLV